MDITLKQIDKMTDEELKNAIDACFDEAPETDQINRLAILLEAQFYRAERYKRAEDKDQHKRDDVETGRWRIDQRNEKIIIGMIGIEILLAIGLAIWGDWRQTHDMIQQLAAFEKMHGALSRLETNSGKTTTALEKLNDKIQRELDLTYEPSLNVVFDGEKGSLEVENKGRANIELWQERFNDRVNVEKHPILITTGWPNRVSLPTGLMKGIAKGHLTGRVILYLKTEAGTEYEAVCTLENQRADEGFKTGVQSVQLRTSNWSRDKNH